jgi:hypothetical protein
MERHRMRTIDILRRTSRRAIEGVLLKECHTGHGFCAGGELFVHLGQLYHD